MFLVSRRVNTVIHVKYTSFTMLRCCKGNENRTVRRKLKYLCLGILTIFKTII